MGKTREYRCECGTTFEAKVADRKRGWARSCSKSCAARKRERKLDRNDYAGRFKNAAVANGGFSDEEHDCNKS